MSIKQPRSESRFTIGPFTLVVLSAAATVGIAYWLGQDQRREELRERQRDTTAIQRWQELDALSEEGEAAVPILLRWMEGDDLRARRDATLVLSRIGPPARDAVPALERALQDSDARVRANAATALGKIDHDLVRLLPSLATALFDVDLAVRNAAAEALAPLGILAADRVAEEFVKAPPQQCEQGMLFLGHLGVSDSAAREAARRIVANDTLANSLRETAYSLLALEGELSLSEISVALQSNNTDFVITGLHQVVALGPEAAAQISLVVPLLEADDESVRLGALGALAAIGSAAHAELPRVERAIEAKTQKVGPRDYRDLQWRVQGAVTCWKLGAERETLRETLQGMVTVENREKLPTILSIMLEVAPDDARGWLPRFIAWVEDPKGEVQYAGLMGLRGLGPEGIGGLPQVIAILRSPNTTSSDAWRKWEAMDTLIALRPPAASVLQFLIETLGELDDQTLTIAFRNDYSLFRDFGPESADALPLLLEYLDRISQTSDALSWSDELGRLCLRRALALEAIRRMGVWNDEVARRLTSALSDPAADVRIFAIPTYAQLQPDPSQTVALLQPLLQDDDYHVVRQAVIALGNLGPAASSAAPDLRTALSRQEFALPPQVAQQGSSQILAAPDGFLRGKALAGSRFRPPKRVTTIREEIVEALRRIEGDAE
ncbi:MAG: HEAT repeat domain-containing protein [Planctomycetales bacterium]